MEQMINIAKEKDNGTFAKYGMRDFCAKWFGIKKNYAECIMYIVDTYLECIDDIDFDVWLKGTEYPTRPMIFTRTELEASFSDLLLVTEDLDCIVDLFMCLYDQEFWVDEENDCIYACEFNDEFLPRVKLNFIGIAMEYERLCTKHELEQITWEDIDDIIYILNEYGYDMEKDYKYRVEDVYETASIIEDRLKQIFPL